MKQERINNSFPPRKRFIISLAFIYHPKQVFKNATMEPIQQRIFQFICKICILVPHIKVEKGAFVSYNSKASIILSSLFCLLATAAFIAAQNQLQRSSDPKILRMNYSPFFLTVGWFQRTYSCTMTSAIFIISIINRQTIGQFVALQRRLHHDLTEIYPHIKCTTPATLYSRLLIFLFVLITIKLILYTNLVIRFSQMMGSTTPFAITMVVICRLPMIAVTVINSLFLEQVAYLEIFVDKLNRILKNASIEKETVDSSCRLSDLIDEMAIKYDEIYDLKCAMNRMISICGFFLAIQRYVDMTVKLFQVYYFIKRYLEVFDSRAFKIFLTGIFDFAISLLESLITASQSERLIEKVGRVGW